MSLLADAYELGRATGRLEQATKELRREIRETALTIGKAYMDAIARDTMLQYTEPELPTELDGLPFLDDVQAGEQARTWYRVRAAPFFVAYIHGFLHHELRVYRADGSRVAEWDALQKGLAGEPVLHVLRRAPDMIRGLQ